jgi:hypothetical protein
VRACVRFFGITAAAGLDDAEGLLCAVAGDYADPPCSPNKGNGDGGRGAASRAEHRAPVKSWQGGY